MNENFFDYILQSKKFSPSTEFLIQTYLYMQEILSKCKKIVYARMFIDNIITENWYKKNNLTMAEYFEYHMEAYIIHFDGLFDRILILINYLFDINILNRRKITSKNILKALEDKPEHIKLYKILSFIDGKFRPMIQECRHASVHYSGFSISLLNELQGLELMYLQDENIKTNEKNSNKV
jgi:hypothetical protein